MIHYRSLIGSAERTPRQTERGPAEPAGDRPLLRTLRVLYPLIRPQWPELVLALASVVAITLVGLLRPWPIKFLIDDVLQVGKSGAEPKGSTTVILSIAGAIVAIGVLQGLFSYLRTNVLASIGQRVAFGLRSTLFSHLQRLPLAFHDRQRTGDIVTRVTSDVTRVQELIMDDLLLLAATRMLQVGGMLVVMLVIDWRLGLIAALMAPLTTLTAAFYRRRIRAREGDVRQREGDIASLTQETMSSIRVVKAFGRSELERERFDEYSSDMMERGVDVARLEAAFGWALTATGALGVAAVAGVGAYEVIAGTLSAGTLVVFIQYMRDLQSPLMGLSKLSAKLAKASVRAERIMQLLDERPDLEDRPDARQAPRLRGEIRFDHVSFGYEPDRLALRDVSLEIEAGTTLAVVGRTGAGKSTLANLIVRLYDPLTGSVRVDGQDIRDYTLDSYVAQTSVVLQESLLFRTTIAENIAYGRPSASLKEIREAARIALCEEFVSALPYGYDTVVGERGVTLSGGQRQRIAIARAVIRNAPILVLDEPTTGLDATAEAIVLQALERLMQGPTTVMIGHKLSSARRADKIVVLDGGQIVEQGTHEALLAAGGWYSRAFETQAVAPAAAQPRTPVLRRFQAALKPPQKGSG